MKQEARTNDADRKTITISADVKLPAPVNFLILEGGGQVDVKDVPEADLRRYMAAVTEGLIAHAAKRRLQDATSTAATFSR